MDTTVIGHVPCIPQKLSSIPGGYPNGPFLENGLWELKEAK